MAVDVSRDEPGSDPLARDLVDDWNLECESPGFGSSRPALPIENPRKPGATSRLPSPHESGGPESTSALDFYRNFSLEKLPEPPDAHELDSAPSDLAVLQKALTKRRAPRRPEDRSRRLSSLQPGDDLGGFRLVLELGRGAFARVFLAEELNLGRRYVALKVSPAEGDEPRILARLQHPHIVPVHSVHDDLDTGLRLLCMPYLGGANLSRLLEESWGRPHTQATGRSLVETLDELSQRLPVAARNEASLVFGASRPGKSRTRVLAPNSCDVAASSAVLQARAPAVSARWRGLLGRLVAARSRSRGPNDETDEGLPSRQFLRGADGVQAAVWIVARLAEGLEHAHSRGLLHRDLKPSNILVAADGTPMLLDFNLAAEAEPQTEDDGERIRRAQLGGTLPFMAPEHLDAFDPAGKTASEDVDERSDLYALGLILFQMMAGEPPFNSAGGPATIEVLRAMIEQRRRLPVPSLRARCPAAPVSLEALVSQCLHPDPDRRYQRAHDLADDLRRFLDDLPMKYCPEPSLRERLGKWTRRHPALSSSGSVALVAILLMVLLAGAVGMVFESMQGLATRVRLQVFERGFADSQFLLGTRGRGDGYRKKGVELARRTLEDIGLVVELAASSRWEPGRARTEEWLARLTRNEQERVRRKIVELVILSTRAEISLLPKGASEADRKRGLERAVARLERFENTSTITPASLYSERARYRAALGDAKGATRDGARAAKLPPVSSEDFTLVGKTLLASGDATGAEIALLRAVSLDPTSFWAHFALGHSRFEQGRFAEAAGEFSTCVALGPGFAWAHFNQGLSQAHTGRLTEALAAYDRAILLDPELNEAWVNRALVKLELNQVPEALTDLQHIIARCEREIGVLAAYGETLARLGRHDEAEQHFGRMLEKDPKDTLALSTRGMTRLRAAPILARADFEAAVALDPSNAVAHYGLARLIRAQDHVAAIAHLDRALDSDPNLIDALQLRALIRAQLGDRAALDDVDRLIQTPTAHRLYNAACAISLMAGSDRKSPLMNRSVGLLRRALAAGFPAVEAASDPDLRSLAGRPDYEALMASYSVSRKVSRTGP